MNSPARRLLSLSSSVSGDSDLVKANDGSRPLLPAEVRGKKIYTRPLETYEVVWVEHVSGEVFRESWGGGGEATEGNRAGELLD